MSPSMWRSALAFGMVTSAMLVLAACTQPPASMAPANLDIVCDGEGSPTVILVPGMDTPLDTFTSLQSYIAEDTRVCSYSRAGLGDSPPWPEDAPDPSAGMMADQLRATLDDQKIPGPYVMLGWSWGGIVTQAFAARHRDRIVGMVLEDSASIEQFTWPEFDESLWAEGGRPIDTETTLEEVRDLDLGDLPLVVLVHGVALIDEEGQSNEDAEELWYRAQDTHAGLSDDSLRLIATEAGHFIHFDSEALVEKAVDAVLRSVRDGEPLPPCDDIEWGPYTGACE